MFSQNSRLRVITTIIFVIGCLGAGKTFSQDRAVAVDSLKNELKKYELKETRNGFSLEDSNAVLILEELSSLYRGIDSATTLKYTERCLSLSKQIGFKRGTALAYNALGTHYYVLGNLPEALHAYMQALEIRRELGDPKAIAGSFNNIGVVLQEQGNYTEALTNQFAGLEINEKYGYTNEIGRSYNNIGLIYLAQGNYADALENMQNSLKLMKQLGRVGGIAEAYKNIGNIYKEMGNYPEALVNQFASLKLRKELGLNYNLAESYECIGNIYERLGNYTLALSNYQVSNSIWEKIKNELGVASTNIDIGNLYFLRKQYNEALKYEIKGLRIAEKAGAKDKVKYAYQVLSAINAELHNYKAAYEYQVLFKQISDTIFNKEKSKKLTELKMNYEFDKKVLAVKSANEKKEAAARLEIQEQKSIKYRIISGASVLLLLVVYLVYLYRNRQRQRVLEIRQRISRDLHDEIGASLSSVQIMSVFAEQSLDNTSPAAKQWMRRIGGNTKEMIEKIRDIVWTLNSSKETTGSIVTRMNQFISYALEPKDIICNFKADEKVNEMLNDFVRKRNVYLIFKEAVNNIAKYSSCTETTITLKIEDSKLILIIADNGIGFNTADAVNGNGLSNMKQRAVQLNATFEVSSLPGKGTVVSLIMPLPHLRYGFMKKAG